MEGADTTLPSEGDRTGGDAKQTGTLGTGDRVGRYVVLSVLGSGGMGVVFAAYDPELDRRVAVKLLLPGWGGARARARMQREARSLAKLTHPNVVAVYDVGVHDEQVFVAMELIVGKTLGEWLSAAPRSWSEILGVLTAAGRGLAAAHGAGLVHRDFKPDNAMVADDGRVVVMDFGLARGDGEDSAPIDSEEIARHRSSDLDEDLTRDGAVMGTPAYMAPEQHFGSQVGAAADQFAFCVTALEAFEGRRPFAADSVAETRQRIIDGRVEPAPDESKVPRWIRNALVRGLALEPERRWPSMDALLLELGKDPRRGRRRILAAVLGIAIAGGAWGVMLLIDARREAQCAGRAAQVDEVWNDEAKAAVSEAWLATGLDYAPVAIERAVERLDGQAAEWSEVAARVCRAARDGDPKRTRAADACLDEYLRGVEYYVRVFGESRKAVVADGLTAAVGLRQPLRCDDPNIVALQSLPPEDPEAREAWNSVADEIRHADTLSFAGRGDEAEAHTRAAFERAVELQYPRLVTRAKTRLADLAERRGDYEQAERLAFDAFVGAGRLGDDALAADAAHQLAWVYVVRGKAHEALRWVELGEMMVERLGTPAPGSTATLANARVGALVTLEDYEGAVEEAQRAVAAADEAFGPGSAVVADLLGNLGTLQAETGDFDGALANLERSLRIEHDLLGANHASTLQTRANFAHVLWRMGEHDRAIGEIDDAVAGLEALLGAEHWRLAGALQARAQILAAVGRHADAEVAYRRTVAIVEQTRGPDDRELVGPYVGIANARLAQGDAAGAVEPAERAHAIAIAQLEPDNPKIEEARAVLEDARARAADE